MIYRHLFTAFFVLILLTLTVPTWAGGLYINEFGTPSMGVASQQALKQSPAMPQRHFTTRPV